VRSRSEEFIFSIGKKSEWAYVFGGGAFFQKSVRETIFVHTGDPKGGGGLSFTRSKKSVSLYFIV
tara:strand:- start:50 stop:244 length:195 start_codon:yes stop_codon:yes gene_type:complete